MTNEPREKNLEYVFEAAKTFFRQKSIYSISAEAVHNAELTLGAAVRAAEREEVVPAAAGDPVIPVKDVLAMLEDARTESLGKAPHCYLNLNIFTKLEEKIKEYKKP